MTDNTVDIQLSSMTGDEITYFWADEDAAGLKIKEEVRIKSAGIEGFSVEQILFTAARLYAAKGRQNELLDIIAEAEKNPIILTKDAGNG